MSTWFILASGPSMCQADADAVRGRGVVVAINQTIRLAPWADILYAGDASWWKQYGRAVKDFRGRRVGLSMPGQQRDIEHLLFRMGAGLGLQRINHGNNSGFQAINFAYLEGARRIVLLGYDMQHFEGQHHWHEDYPADMGNFNPGMPELCAPKFGPLAADLAARGIEVINATRRTALTCFKRMPLADVLCQPN